MSEISVEDQLKALQEKVQLLELENKKLKDLVNNKQEYTLKDRTSLVRLLGKDRGVSYIGKVICLGGWIRTMRKGRGDFCFIELSDGTIHSSIQIVAEKKNIGDNFDELLKSFKTGASIFVVGEVVSSPGKGQLVEIVAQKITILGECYDSATYPLSKKKHSLEHLREHLHLRPRTRVIGSIARIRNALAFSTHKFFNERNFLYIHTPILTSSDCEGAGEMFQVTTLFSKTEDDPSKLPLDSKKKIDYKEDFFKKPTYLSVSGQLNVETFACALSNVYTFGPTFRAEMAHTSRHLAEFWMIEPEIAFADLEENMDVAEAYIKYIIKYVLDHCADDLEYLESFEEERKKELETEKKQQKNQKGQKPIVDWKSKKLRERLENTVTQPFQRLSYTDAIDILLKVKDVKFEVEPTWGVDLGSEHETYLAEVVYQKPVILKDYPKDIKAFYMKLNDDNKTVAAMDILVPGIGELVGGSQREDRLDVLEQRIKDGGLDPEAYTFYTDLRKYGSVPHSGFGLGFERMVRYVTGIDNIRDVIPFPRYHEHCRF